MKSTDRTESLELNLDQNILVITEKTPQYNGGGGQHKILYTTYYNLPDIHYFIFNEKWENVPQLTNWTQYFNVKEKKLNPKWRYGDYLSSFSMKQERFLRSHNYISQIFQTVQEIIQEKNIKVLIFEQTGILMWPWCEHFAGKVKCIMRIHDSHYHYFLFDVKTRKNLLTKISDFGMAFFQRKYEDKYIRQWDQIQFLSQSEFNFYREKYPEISTKFVYTPPSIMIRSNQYLENPDKKIDILLVGSMSWKPNSDAAKWFLVEVLPLIKLELPDIKVRISGWYSKEKLETQDTNVEVTGFVDSLDESFGTSKVAINPLISGGGIKVKVMEYAALGFPIVSTDHGVLGLKDDISCCLCVAKTKEEFAASVVRLLKDANLREEYSNKVFKYAQENFDITKNQIAWKAALQNME